MTRKVLKANLLCSLEMRQRRSGQRMQIRDHFLYAAKQEMHHSLQYRDNIAAIVSWRKHSLHAFLPSQKQLRQH